VTLVRSYGLKLTTVKLLPQEKFDDLMADHFATFITNYDLDTLNAANIDTIRIPVTYNTFVSERNRTDVFPKGERTALNKYSLLLHGFNSRFIQRVLEHGMDVWLDLMVSHNNQLGVQERSGNVDPDVVRRAIEYIGRTYDSRVAMPPIPADFRTLLVSSFMPT